MRSPRQDGGRLDRFGLFFSFALVAVLPLSAAIAALHAI
jgi:hypothetical protein